MPTPVIVTVAIPTPLHKEFDYKLPISHKPTPSNLVGARVRVPFGRQTLIGVIIATPNHSTYDPNKLKAIDSLLDDTPLFPKETLDFYTWASRYYLHPLGEVISAALPSALRQGNQALLLAKKEWQLTTSGQQDPASLLPRAPKQAQLLGKLQAQASWSEVDLKLQGISTSQLKPLVDKSHLQLHETLPEKSTHAELLAQPALTLTHEQTQALANIEPDTFNAHLIFGATGSGKTEIYLQALQKTLEQGQQALILVPEIGLTPQTIQRFQARFNRTVTVLHSNLNDTERKQAWLQASKGISDIIIGTRSAIFTPIPKLGLIVIDEEHDPSFKQQDGFRYHARDLAAVRAQRLQIPLLLGSATPSLESLHNAEQKRYELSRLHHRAGNASKPSTDIIDLRRQTLREGLSEPLLENIKETLNAGQQVLIFINRRGFSPTLLCHPCGWVAQCPRCESRLTVHQKPSHLHCHHCDYQRGIPKQCPTCHSHELQCVGQGTERSEQALSHLFPDVPVIRVDRDSTRRKDSLSTIIDTINQGNPCILVGTQMLAKGHHFPNITLVAILDADTGLFSTDFRGVERFGQLLLQVSGRAGREDKPGKVIIQTHLSDHPLLQTLVHHGYDQFAQLIQQERKLASLPPYRPMALLRAESKRADNAHELLHRCKTFLNTLQPAVNGAHVLGPLPAPMEKRNERFRFQLHITCNDRQQRHTLCAQLITHIETLALARRVRWSLDIDPQDMS